MSQRNNQSRTGTPEPTPSTPKPQVANNALLDFVSPTQFVLLPSKGLGYDQSHPLCNKEQVEIRYMTAKDEDILSSEALLRKGVALDRFLENILMDKNFPVDSLLIGDKNAILISARTSGYGNLYETKVVCPSCGFKSELTFDLNSSRLHHGEIPEDCEKTENGTFKTKLPVSGIEVEFRLLNSKDEKTMIKALADAQKRKTASNAITNQYGMMIVSANGVTNKYQIGQFIDVMPIGDSKHLRKVYQKVSPNIELKHEFECNSCGYEQELEVPFGADFFWPDA